MNTETALKIHYEDHTTVTELIDVITYCAESVSLGFDRWDDSYVKGPGLYFVIVTGTSITGYADPMGANRWPIDNCRVVTADEDRFFQTAQTVAVEADGAIVVTVDGYLHEQMVRLKDLSTEELTVANPNQSLEYADWMGSRHMSALDTSLREEVVAAITLSEENGRVTTFRDGDYNDARREELASKWRNDE